jgi:hypothetical protein
MRPGPKTHNIRDVRAAACTLFDEVAEDGASIICSCGAIARSQMRGEMLQREVRP